MNETMTSTEVLNKIQELYEEDITEGKIECEMELLEAIELTNTIKSNGYKHNIKILKTEKPGIVHVELLYSLTEIEQEE